ncbi:formylglycine-generating enzyme family protein [Pedobacter sp. BS3]|uniref:formylglycine-generating enzyme family protein n=1 Tax=Pedobacter sp. BS3 TaxID=2567937 RepID=UPI0011EE7088|nr:formylglycine-generating enzyme family protein [Pedobacter sp. BS3]TZF81151.1 formylglycine-generating enzyme family protein [Pedobacter sp. BS3]
MNAESKPCCSAQRPASVLNVLGGLPPNVNNTVEGMVLLPGGSFLMGTESDEGFWADGEGPVREVTVNSFYMDEAAVTNSQFAEFIRATGYQTDAERFGWSFVFDGLLDQKTLTGDIEVVEQTPWWCIVPGACWNHPEGWNSSLKDRMEHPVVHISWNDAVAYARWAGKRLPTEAEWEYAARGGLVQKMFPWGDELTPDGEHYCNIWQGVFPGKNTLEDGYLGTAPAKSFKPNGYGLYNMAGNVWEWCSDWFSADFHCTASLLNPQGPPQGQAKVIKGGSFLCHQSYCNRYRVAARSSSTPGSTASNVGFRCVKAC